VSVEPRQGPVLVTIEYEVDDADEQAFHEAMRESRRSWLASGLLAWELYMDVTHPGRYIEHLTDESWAEYVRRNERVTASYLALRDRKHAFHRGSGAPTVRRYVAKRPGRRST
ncbi:MAG: MFS transporter, partial [Stenotrophomonas maltophilia]